MDDINGLLETALNNDNNAKNNTADFVPVGHPNGSHAPSSKDSYSLSHSFTEDLVANDPSGTKQLDSAASNVI